MLRRDFFRFGVKKIAETAFEVASEVVESHAAGWIRPPFAKPELPFLLGCTRCDRCIEACPHQVLYRLPDRLGLKVRGTPAMALLQHGCRLCADWPCVAACEPGVLSLPVPPPTDGEDPPPPPPPPRLAAASLDAALCLAYAGPECGACAGHCPIPGALAWTGTRPTIVAELCLGCGLCREACIVQPKAIGITSLRLGVNEGA